MNYYVLLLCFMSLHSNLQTETKESAESESSLAALHQIGGGKNLQPLQESVQELL